jgi:hypothetical protein
MLEVIMIKYILLIIFLLCTYSAYGLYFYATELTEENKEAEYSLFLSKRIDKDVELVGEKLAKERNIKFLLRGMDDLVQCKAVLYSLSFMSHEACGKEVAKEQIKSLMMEWWSMIYNNPVYTEEFDNRTSWPAHKEYYLHPRRFGIKLSFWDEKMNRRSEPYISLVKVCDGKIYYYYRQKEGEALQEPLVETFEEAGWKFKNVPSISGGAGGAQ